MIITSSVYNNYIIIHQKTIIKMIQLNNLNYKHKMIVKAVTWLKDSHLLFDYQFTNNIVKEQFIISLQPSYIFFYRNNARSELLFIKNNQFVPQKIQGAQLLGGFQISVNKEKDKEKKFKISFHDACQFDYHPAKIERIGTEVSNSSGQYKKQGIYFIIRSLKDNDHQPKGFQLKTGQKIKFGRIQFNVTVVKQNDPQQNHKFFDYQQTLVVQNKIYDEQDACKICLSNQQSQPYSFFCTPCDCFGSCSIVHFDCLYQWCKTKVKKAKIGKITHYNFQKFQCEICKKYFPRFIIRNDIKYDLLHIQKIEGSYMVLSSNGQTSQTQKNMIMINYVQNNLLKIGRNQTCDIRIVDISVSRQHASIQTRDGKFYLYDSKSKFGTIVSQPNFQLEVEKIKRGIQVGRSVVTFQLAEKDWEKNINKS